MKLAIKGHATRGKEIIQLLEMLGGNNIHNYGGTFNECYAIDNNKICTIYTSVAKIDNCVIFTLEEFEEKFPYKVGDKVNYVKYNDEYPSVYTIQRMRWTGVTIEYVLDSSGFSALTKDLQPYKEETMDAKETLVQIDLTREMNVNDEIEVILGDYEFVLKDGKTYFVKKQPQYPKTHEECCKVLAYEGGATVIGYDAVLLNSFQKLKLCRDAYWKIAGKAMGLGNPWEPDWCSELDLNYTIIYNGMFTNKIDGTGRYALLAFPTKEMRDAFFENFKELIEQCKELL